MNRSDINYWLSPKFDHSPPTDEELTAGRPIGKRTHAFLLAEDIKTMLVSGADADVIWHKLNRLADMVKDDPEPESADDQTQAHD